MDTIPESQTRSPVVLSFYSETQKQDKNTEEYRNIWLEEGEKIVYALEEISGLHFPEREIKVEVRDGNSSAGIKAGDGTIRLRANFDLDRKRSCLIHELGHRHLFSNGISRTPELSEHRILYLILYDVWERLYGKEFADRQVEVEKGIPNPQAPYKECWEYALSLSKSQRKEIFSGLVRKNNAN